MKKNKTPAKGETVKAPVSEIVRSTSPKVESKLTHVGFKADEETLAAIVKLVSVINSRPGIVAKKSVAIRRALIEAAARLSDPRVLTSES